jgi:hypothetical protein
LWLWQNSGNDLASAFAKTLVSRGVVPPFYLQKTGLKANLKKLGIQLLGGVSATH